MKGLTRRGARVAGVVAGGAALVAVVALGAGALATPAASPRESPPATPPGQAQQKEPPGNGLGPRSPVPVDCASARNHGEYVSGLARTTPPGPDKGAVVAAAAQADCPAGFRDRPED